MRARATYGVEVALLLFVSLGKSAVYSVLSILDMSTRPGGVAAQTAQVNPVVVPDRPWLDALYQIAETLLPVVPALLAVYLLGRSHADPWAAIGLDVRGGARRWGRDLAAGLGLAALIGIPGLGFYLLARATGLAADVQATGLGTSAWAVVVLVGRALMNGVVEEVIVVAYLFDRLPRLGWPPWAVLAGSALLRGTYHLYQGWGGFLGNIVMGVVFGLFYRRTGRVLPLVVAHTAIDIVAFIGYAVLAPRVGWL